MNRASFLVIGIGNPSRGDDALGPAFLERIKTALAAQLESEQLELLTDFQLQVEHALDLEGRKRVVFVDASVSATPPFEWRRLSPAKSRCYTTHALSPCAVLETYERILGTSPEAWELAIRGKCFELGEGLSPEAIVGLAAAVGFFVEKFGDETQTKTAPEQENRLGVRWTLRGAVQGVGFRPWVLRQARELNLQGRVLNTSGAVVVEAYGAPTSLDAFEKLISLGGPRAARIEACWREALPAPKPELSGFHIETSRLEETTSLPLPADLSTCEECLAETRTQESRYYGYAFTSCTQCGPRFAITEALPFDRQRTTMKSFALCDDCGREYEDPNDRRFHAQTIACGACGPQLSLYDARGTPWPVSDAPSQIAEQQKVLLETAQLLRSGKILAIKGLSAFHLACDATQEEAVGRLRQRKRRDSKPFAVMVQDLDAAERYAELNAEARQALCSLARPIVLLPAVYGAVAPAVLSESDRIGLLLPYSPLHSLLLANVGGPLVMTSGNVCGEPVCKDNEEAFQRLGTVADAFLLHDRAIARRVEDSVVSNSARGFRPLRRSRGFVPRPIHLPLPAPQPILAVGGHLKNTICLVIEDRAYLSGHLGDLDSLESERVWNQELESMEQLLGVHPEVLAHDSHPDYATTRYARSRKAQIHFEVQHHLAHVLAAMAELGLTGKAIGLAFDGMGHGLDGTAWGGEFLVVEGTSWQRFASFRPLALPGGEVAVRQVWRQAFALLVDAFEDQAAELTREFACFRQIPRTTLGTLDQMIRTGIGVQKARGVGRLFDAVGALCLGFSNASFEGQVALALEASFAATQSPRLDPYPWTAPTTLSWDKSSSFALSQSAEIDLRPTTRALVSDLASSVSPAQVAARFHSTIVAAAAEVTRRARVEVQADQIVLSGGAFQNRYLEAELLRQLGSDCVKLTRDIPVGDGGLALGQAWSAVLNLRELNAVTQKSRQPTDWKTGVNLCV